MAANANIELLLPQEHAILPKVETIWIRAIFQQFLSYGAYHTLLRELRVFHRGKCQIEN